MIHESVKMVFVSFISSAILFSALFYVNKVLKKRIPLPLTLILISLLPLISMLRLGTYESGDLSIHASFGIIFFQSIKEGIPLPVWHSYASGGYGYPYFLFTYPLPYYLSAVFHVVGFSFISSFKLIASLAYILSGLAAYLWVKEETKNKFTGFIAGIFYLFAPYHFVDLHFRFAIGEVLAFFFLPLCFYLIKRVQDKKYLNTLGFVFSFAGLILSHQAIGFITLGILFLYTLIFSRNEKHVLVRRLIALVCGALVTAFYWLPLLVESRYTHLLNWNVHFYPLITYLFSPARLGLLYQGNRGELYFPIGYLHLPIVIISFFILLIPGFRKKFFKKDLELYLFSLFIFASCFFIMQAESKPLWNTLFFLKGFQFSYRFSMFCALFSSVIAALTLTKIKNKNFVYLVLFLTIMITILNWGNRRTIPQITDKVLEQELSTSAMTQGQGTTIWANMDALPKREADVDLLDGSARIREIFRNSVKHEYLISVNPNKASFIENTTYFPGWNLTVNGKYRNLTPSKDGLLSFSLGKGLYLVDIEFKQTNYQVLGRFISLVTIILLSIPALKNLRR